MSRQSGVSLVRVVSFLTRTLLPPMRAVSLEQKLCLSDKSSVSPMKEVYLQ